MNATVERGRPRGLSSPPHRGGSQPALQRVEAATGRGRRSKSSSSKTTSTSARAAERGAPTNRPRLARRSRCSLKPRMPIRRRRTRRLRDVAERGRPSSRRLDDRVRTVRRSKADAGQRRAAREDASRADARVRARRAASPRTCARRRTSWGSGWWRSPKRSAGAGLGLATAVLLEEEVAYGDPAAAFAFGGPGAFGMARGRARRTRRRRRHCSRRSPGADGWKRFGAVAWGEKKASSQRAGLATTRDEARRARGSSRREGVRRERRPRRELRRVRAGRARGAAGAGSARSS